MKKKEEAEEDDFKDKMTRGAILKLKGVPCDLSRDAIKEVFMKYIEVAWVDWDSETGEVLRI